MERCYELRRSTTIQLPNITDITFLKLWDMVLLNLEKIRRHPWNCGSLSLSLRCMLNQAKILVSS